MTRLHEVNVSVADLLKATLAGLPCLITLIVAIVHFSKWTERVNYRLDDIDKDLKGIHLRIDQASPKPVTGDFTLPDYIEPGKITAIYRLKLN